MKLRLTITIFSILIGFLVFLVNWQFCLPDGCIFNPQNTVCQDGSCVDEDIGSHLNERPQFTTSIIRNILLLCYLIILGVLLFLISDNKTQLLECQRKIKLVFSYLSFEHNWFTFLFAKGLLNPKSF